MRNEFKTPPSETTDWVPRHLNGEQTIPSLWMRAPAGWAKIGYPKQQVFMRVVYTKSVDSINDTRSCTTTDSGRHQQEIGKGKSRRRIRRRRMCGEVTMVNKEPIKCLAESKKEGKVRTEVHDG